MAATGLLVTAVIMAAMATPGGSIPGGRKPASVDGPGVVNASLAAVEAFNRGSNELYRSGVSRVVEAQTQVVSGLLYHLKVELKTTTCRKSSGRTVSVASCPFAQKAKKRLCEFTVWDQAWLGPPQVTIINCMPVTG